MSEKPESDLHAAIEELRQRLGVGVNVSAEHTPAEVVRAGIARLDEVQSSLDVLARRGQP